MFVLKDILSLKTAWSYRKTSRVHEPWEKAVEFQKTFTSSANSKTKNIKVKTAIFDLLVKYFCDVFSKRFLML